MPIIGQWAFEDSDGTGVDTSGTGNTAAFTDGAFQNATGSAEFDGVNDYVEISDAAQYAITNATIHGTFTAAVGSLDGTLSTTVNDPSLQALVSRDSSGFDGGGHLTVYVDGDGSIYIRHQSDTQDYEIRTAPGLVTEGQEFDLVYEFGDTGGMVLYVDGVQVGSNTDPVSNGDSIALSGNNEPWTLGASQVLSGDGVADGLQQFFEGSIGHFEIYDEALSPAELNVLHDLSDGVDDGLIAGTAGDDTIFGGPSVNAEDGGLVIDDTITAGDGADVVYAGDGNDSVSGGAGADSMLGGSGADTLYGNDGADTIDGGDGADRIEGGVGNDSITGGLGDDYILGDAGDDTLSGGDGADTVLGGTEADDISGGDGADILYGNLGNDTIDGGAGNDTIYVVGGDDSIDAGDDADYIAMFDNFGTDTVAGGEGGSDTDQIDLQNLTSGVIVTFTGAEAGTISDGTDTVQFSEVEHFNLTGQADSLDGSASTAYMGVAGGVGNDTITTGAGDDIVLGGQGDDQIQGGQGNDSLDGGEGADVVLGGTENDTILGGAGNDVLYGNDGTDILDGGTGHDTIYIGGGSDSVTAGDDADMLVFVDGYGDDTVAGGEGGVDSDQIDLQYLSAGVTVTYSGAEAGTIIGPSGTIAFSEVEAINLSGLDDTVDGSLSSATMFIGGGAGNDTIVTGSGDDIVWAGAGHDVLQGGLGNDTIDGGAGNDIIYVDGGSDSIVGGDDGDQIFFFDGTGSNLVTGGEGGADTDIINLQYLTSGTTGSLSGDEAGSISDGTLTIDFTQVENVILTGQADVFDGSAATSYIGMAGGEGDDTLTGGAGDDLILGGGGQDVLAGGDGADNIGGDGGHDSISGGAGDDTITGGLGDDTISAGAGNDDIQGNDGADTLVVATGDGNDTFDGGAEVDVLDMSGVTESISTSATTAVSGTTQVSFSNIEHIIGSAQSDTISFNGGTQAMTIQAGGGNDTLLGSNAADSIYGEDGADTFYSVGDGADDLLDGGAGADYVLFLDGFGHDTVVGGDETDRIDLSNLSTGVSVSFSAPLAGTITAGADSITFSETEIFDLTAQDDTVQGGTSYLNLYAGDGNDSVEGSTANDGIHLGDGNDTATGGLGRDHIRGELGNDEIDGGADGDWLYGGEGEDSISGGAGDDDIGGDAGNDTISGGTGDDTISTGAGDDLIIFEKLGAHDTVTDFDIGDTDGDGKSNDQLDVSDLHDLDGNPVNVWDVVVSDDGSGNAVLTFPEGEKLTLQGIAPAQMTGPQMMASGIPCFTAGTMILTPQSERPVEELRVGDLVTTQDRGPQPIRWIARRSLGRDDLAASPELRPIRLGAGWTGAGRDLVVSRQHGIVASKSGNSAAFLVRANQLAQMKGGKVRVARGIRRVTYVHLLLPRHEIIYANGTAVESFYPGPQSMESLAPPALLSLIEQLPRLAIDGPEATYGPSALRYIPTRDLPATLSMLQASRLHCHHIA